MKTSNEIFQDADSPGQVLRALYLAAKEQNPRISLASICKKAGIPSKGYLADVMGGKRTLKEEYVLPLARAFSLEAAETKAFRILSQIEQCRFPADRANLEGKLASVRKLLRIHYRDELKQGLDTHTLVKLMAVFDLFREPPSLEQLQERMPQHPPQSVEAALGYMTGTGVAGRTENGGYKLLRNQLVFRSADRTEARIQYFDRCLQDASKGVSEWISSPDVAYFESSFVSVKRDRYAKALQEIRSVFERLQSDLESPEADDVIQFNIQIFPSSISRT